MINGDDVINSLALENAAVILKVQFLKHYTEE